MSFEVGDVVECVDASVSPHAIHPELTGLLTEGARYTVTWFGATYSLVGPSTGISVAEIKLPYGKFYSGRFRKIQGPDESIRVAEMRKEPVSK